jgi:NADPH2:quinone reductase
MKAMVIDGFGGPDRLHMADVPTPEPEAGEVLIRIDHTSVNPVDWKIREGLLASLFPHDFPLIPGWDAAGTIAGVGAGTEGFAEGDRVWAYCRKPKVQWGTYAPLVTMPAEAVAPMPGRLDFAQAATVPLAALTAWQALFAEAKLGRGQTVLIHAAAGGVGSFAVQFARWAGAAVIGTASAANHSYVKDLGADHAIDYRQEDFVQACRRLAPEGVDVALVAVGGEALARSYDAVKRGGRLVSIVDPPIEEEAARTGVGHGFVFVAPSGDQLRRIAQLMDEGVVRPPAIEVLPLDQAAAAQERVRAGHVRGKIALAIP